MKKIIMFCLIICIIFLNRCELKNNYLIEGLSDYDKKNIYQISIYNKSVAINIFHEKMELYFLKDIQIIYHNEMIGSLKINRYLKELECNKNSDVCFYEISEREISKILNEKKFDKKIRTRFFEYNRNFFDFKIVFRNIYTNQDEEFLIKDVKMRYKKWYDFEIPYY